MERDRYVTEKQLAEILLTVSCGSIGAQMGHDGKRRVGKRCPGSTIRGAFTFEGMEWVATGACYGAGKKPTADAYRLVPRSEFTEPVYEDLGDKFKKNPHEHGYHGVIVLRRGKEWVLVGPEAEFRCDGVPDENICQICRWAREGICAKCCTLCTRPCNSAQSCGLLDDQDTKAHRWEQWEGLKTVQMVDASIAVNEAVAAPRQLRLFD